VSACIIYCLDLNDLLNIISLICSILCACYTIFVVRVFFVIEGHIVNKLYNLIMLPSRNKVIIIIIIIPICCSYTIVLLEMFSIQECI